MSIGDIIKGRPRRDYHVKGRKTTILKCIKDNMPDFKHCHDCDFVSQCSRIRKRMGV